MNYTTEQFRMEVIKYLNQHWQEEITVTQIAETMNYTERYFQKKFKDSFPYPFSQYVTKFQLRRVAEMMIEKDSVTNMGRYAGFSSTQSFSKGFRKEFGVSPRKFLKSGMEIPDMPDEWQIAGYPIEITCRMMETKSIHGKRFPLLEEKEIDYVSDRGRHWAHAARLERRRMGIRNEKEETIGMWWHDDQCDMSYLLGYQTEEKEAPEGMIMVRIPEDYYVVLSVSGISEEDRNPDITSQIINGLSKYAEHIWLPLNNKQYKIMSIVYETYEKDRISLSIPLHKRDAGAKEADSVEGPEAWCRYMDEHIRDELTIQQVASHFHYSERHFRETFFMYYNISPVRYMKKRRMYLIASELRRKNANVEAVMKKYGIHSVKLFRKAFYEEFQVMPEEYKDEEYKVFDIQQYYSAHKETLEIRYVQQDTFYMVGKGIMPEIEQENQMESVITYIIYALQREDEDFVRICREENASPDSRIVLWQTDHRNATQVCLIGME